ncbi:MAG: hypothetical protein Q9175_004266 [Cornicularia normoerica]
MPTRTPVGLAVQAVQVVAGIRQEIKNGEQGFLVPKGLHAIIVRYKTGGSEQPEVGNRADRSEPLGARRRYERARNAKWRRRAQGIREQSSKRLLQENVLYLMVVNVPTEEE